MSILKFAQFATIEAKVAPAGITRTAVLHDARRHQFDYTPKPGFLYVRSRAISSRTNDNFDTYPADELRKAYRTFVGKPVFVNHNNDDPRRGRGIILDAVLHEHTAPDGSPDTWVEVLMEVDAVRFPRLAKAILDGDIDRTSMGCNVMSSECSYCGRVASTPDQYCEHINNQKGRRLRRRAASGGVESVLVHEVCRGLSFFENSLLVDEPADPTAFFTGVDDSGMRMAQKVAAFKLAIGVGDYGTPDERREVARANPGRVMYLDQTPDGRFDLSGRSVVRCTECDKLIEESGFANAAENAYFKHMALDHNISIPMLPKGSKMAKMALGSEWDYGPTEPGPNAGVRWEGVATEGQGYRVIVLWPEYADSMAAMLSGTFKDPERAEEWAQKCRDLGAVLVEIRPPMARYDPVVAAKTAISDEIRELMGSYAGGWIDDWDEQGDALVRLSNELVGKTVKTLYDDGVIAEVTEEGVWVDGVRRKSQAKTYFMVPWDEIGMLESISKKADYDEVHRAHPIETLRNQTCPVCKTQNTWDGNICTVCGYVLPPKPFRAPDTDVTGRVDPDEGWFDPDAKRADPFDPVPDRDTAMKGQKDQGDHTMAQSIAAAARQRLQANQALAAQRRAGMPPGVQPRRHAADDASWASPGVVSGGDGTITGDPVPAPEAPSETTEGAINLPDATDVDVETVGGTGVEGTEPDATADVTDVGGEVPDSPPLDVVDVEAPVAGATDVDAEAASDERPNVDNSAESADGTPLNAADWNTASRRAARSEMENIRTAVRDRIFSALRLSKLRIAVGVAEHGDELALAREIENSRLSNESIANEIKALGLVYSRQRQTQTMPTAPHQRSARRSPSMAGGSTPLQSLGSGGGQDDEALFEP